MTAVPDGEGFRLEPSSGGLATGLKGLHQQSDNLWIGWPGANGGPDLDMQLLERRLVPVPLSDEEVRRYYEGYSNGVLWPLFHYLPGRLPLRAPDYEVYRAVNEKFADAIAAVYRPGDRIWVHDYQLMLVPGMVRSRVEGARIGFFLHIPFPSSEVFRTLPQREAILEGLLGADVVGFHTAAYMRHFATGLLRVAGISADVDRVRHEGREIRLGVFPMGIEAERWAARGSDPEVKRLAAEFRGEPGSSVFVGIDRLDYTKGLLRRLLAFEELLARHPELRGKVRMVQVAVPSRTAVDSYRDYRQQMDEIIGRIHGAFATPNWVPIHYIYRGLSEAEVSALYQAADVMLVTPLCDGMNLVAKEFVASRVDGDGVLVLSEFAGAASELAESLQVNPYDVEGTADALFRALTMPEDERRTRMVGLRNRVMKFDLLHWVKSFLEALEEEPKRAAAPPTQPAALEEAFSFARRARDLVLLLDYDGTLVELANTPELARPDRALLDLLAAIGGRPRTSVHVVSGRSTEVLERWLGRLPLHLHAEHGTWSKAPGAAEWVSPGGPPDVSWIPSAAAILEQFAARTPGSLVERKSTSIAWHYRMADPEFGPLQANELRLLLTELLSNVPVRVVQGNKVVEVRPHAGHKGRIVGGATAGAAHGAHVVAIGDDETDEDLFAAAPAGALTVKVGSGPTRASVVVEDVAAVRGFLRSLVET